MMAKRISVSAKVDIAAERLRPDLYRGYNPGYQSILQNCSVQKC
jgi:hypothetical protein